MSGKQQFFSGARAGLPIVLGYLPVSIAFAVMARQAGLTAAETVFLSATVYAGASQMMAVGMLAQGAGIAAIVLAAFIMNLRHVIMSTCVFNDMAPAPLSRRLLAAFGVTDEAFGVYSTLRSEEHTLPFFLGLAGVSYCSWVTGTALGALFSAFLPAVLTASLGIALYAMFIGLLAPELRGNTRLTLLVLLAGGLNALLSQFMDGSWALIAATLLAAFCGLFFVELGEEGDDRAQ